MYHITACTAGREPCLGEVVQDAVVLSQAGLVVRDELLRTPVVRTHADIDAWVIMPDHFHVILVLDGEGSDDGADERPGPRLAAGSVGSIVNHIKGVSTRKIRALGYRDFRWQSRFHDRIIRSESQLEATRRYIMANPAAANEPFATWGSDRERAWNRR
jgi:REP element-mobilizing transposase RayT